MWTSFSNICNGSSSSWATAYFQFSPCQPSNNTGTLPAPSRQSQGVVGSHSASSLGGPMSCALLLILVNHARLHAYPSSHHTASALCISSLDLSSVIIIITPSARRSSLSAQSLMTFQNTRELTQLATSTNSAHDKEYSRQQKYRKRTGQRVQMVVIGNRHFRVRVQSITRSPKELQRTRQGDAEDKNRVTVIREMCVCDVGVRADRRTVASY